ncbi:hypothetical protein DN069_15310 [Streptacidiphilus pinicola]|uniref:Uncharacterized protein n=1 Tax=Streptacidiphilus pinicola TaxID=2219663 RepID=A0A2X0II62_9ACTN|nr:hypothetical protein [Streptacidiphilus pinicola]RAG84802.1 hypothetical protein DN069_15310 [Streptacidiphilus pinicola]
MSDTTPDQAAPTPLLRMLQLPGLPDADGDVPVCGPDGCTVPAPAAQPTSATPATSEQDS